MIDDTSSDGTKQNPYANQPDNPTKSPDIPNTRNWHRESTLPNGWRVGKLGAKWYVLDKDGWAISDGHHEISDDGRKGKLGASDERIDLRGQPGRYDEADT